MMFNLLKRGWIFFSRYRIAFRWIFLNSFVTPLYSKHIRVSILRLMGSDIAKGVSIYRNGYI